MKQSFLVQNIKCGGCAGTITNALKDRFPDIEINLDVEPRIVTATVKNEEDKAYLKSTLKKLGYPMADEELGAIEGTLLKGKSFVSCAIGKFDKTKEN